MPAADPARPLARRAALPPAHCRYGVLPGYGIAFQSGFQDTFTATATAALEVGAFPYAAGVIDNWLAYYARDNGMVTYRAEELAQSGRMLTIFALYHSYTGDHALLLKHYGKVCCAPLPPPPHLRTAWSPAAAHRGPPRCRAVRDEARALPPCAPQVKAMAEWLLYRYEMSLQWPKDDPRHGIVAGGDEGDGFVAHYESYGATPLQHKYSCTSNVWRGFVDAAAMWRQVAKATGRADVGAHAAALAESAPKLYEALQASLAKTTWETGNPRAPRCVPTGADDPGEGNPPIGCLGDCTPLPAPTRRAAACCA